MRRPTRQNGNRAAESARGDDAERDDSTADHAPVETLHGAMGNQAVKDLHERGDVQPKLTVSRPADPAEREAERTAETVVDAPGPGETSLEAGERTPGAGGTLDSGTESRIRSVTGGGRPLPDATRSFFESRFGRDFSDVRVHTGPGADAAARSINAEAFTHGTDVVFRSGAYDPRGRRGRRLLAHELTHVVQQSGAGTTVQRQESDGAAEAQAYLELSQSARKMAKDGAKQIAEKIAQKSLGGYYTAGKIATRLAGAAIEGIGKGIEKGQKKGIEQLKKAWGPVLKAGQGVSSRKIVRNARRYGSPTVNALRQLDTVLTEMTVSVAKETVDVVVGHSVDFISGKLGEITNAIFGDMLNNWGLTGWSPEGFIKDATDEQVRKVKSNMKQYLEGILRSALEDEGV